ncbi:MAG: FMN-binding protein [Gammaproteobacteria bacterium]
MRLLSTLLVTATLLLGTGGVQAEDVYQDPRAFLEEVFGGEVPAPQKLWVKREVKDGIRAIMGHDLGALRIRYWARAGRTAWILDDIGKEQFITTGLVVENGELSSVRVLVYRESRGWEVRYPAFTDQFRGAHLDDDLALDRGIDGISGATLSVQALTRLARLALLLDRHVHS